MRTFKKHLKESLKNNLFKDLFQEERELLKVSVKIHEARKEANMTQAQIAEAAHLTQQQVSKVENGVNCNILTYLKVGHVMGLSLGISISH